MNFSDLSAALGHNSGMVLAAILGLAGMLTLLLVTLVAQWRIYSQSEREREFKRELLSDGFSPGDVEKIIGPATQSRRITRRRHHSLSSRVAKANALSNVQ
jgi:hypothetical protein